jgi:ribose/xylose/arabinose/galactoside ABC-type transport system permease subunit
LGLLSLAMMLVMLSGGIDLSIVATSNLAGILTALILQRCVGLEGGALISVTVLAIAAGLLTSVLVGLANGWLVGTVGVSPILATLGMMTFLGGLALVITGGSALSGLPPTMEPLGHGLVIGVPVPLLIFVACAAGVALLLNRTPWGFHLYRLGANPTAALFSGVANHRVLLATYTLAGLLCGIAGMIMTSRFNSAKAGYGESYLLVTILAAVLGGTSPSGGFGRVSGLVLALAILQVITSGLNLMRVSAFLSIVLWGATILVVMGLNLFVQQLRTARQIKQTGISEMPDDAAH